jgi:hypothetical protein
MGSPAGPKFGIRPSWILGPRIADGVGVIVGSESGEAMPYCPLLFCSNTNCRLYSGGLLLPYPNPPKTKPDPMPWPTDAWQALILCPECKRVHIHTKADIRWRARTDEDYEGYRLYAAWFCARFECAVSGCGTPVELHVAMGVGTTTRAVDNTLRSGDVDGILPCGHLFVPPPLGKCKVVRESYEQPIRSYSQ